MYRTLNKYIERNLCVKLDNYQESRLTVFTNSLHVNVAEDLNIHVAYKCGKLVCVCVCVCFAEFVTMCCILVSRHGPNNVSRKKSKFSTRLNKSKECGCRETGFGSMRGRMESLVFVTFLYH